MKLPENLQKLFQVEEGIWKVKDTNTGSEKFFVFVSKRHPEEPNKRPARQSIANNVTEARQKKKDLTRELEDFIKQGPSTTFAEFMPDYYRYLQQYKRESTIIREKSSIQAHLIPALSNYPLKQISTKQCEELLTEVYKGKNPQTKRHLLTHLSNIFKRAKKLGLVADNPCEPIDLPSRGGKDEPQRVILNESQTQYLLDHLQEFHPEMYYHVVLAYLTGCRAGELRALLWSDVSIDENRKCITISKSLDVKSGKAGPTKTGEQRAITVSDTLLQILLELRSLTFTALTDPVLPHWREFASGEQAKSLKIVCRSIGLPPIHFHALRSCLITHLLVKGVPLSQVKLIAGHRRISSTEIYLKLSGIEADGATNALGYTMSSSNRELKSKA